MLLCLLVMTLVMYNCGKKDEPLPDKPDQGKVDDLNKIEIEPVNVVDPAPVVVTDGSLETSALTTELLSALGGIEEGGVIPAAVTNASAAVAAALSEADLTALGLLDDAMFETIKNGGAIPAAVQAVIDKAAAHPALQAYMPKLTLPTVDGVTITGRRAATTDIATDAHAGDAIEAIQEASDACIEEANRLFNEKQRSLNETKALNDAKATSAYNKVISELPSTAPCLANVDAMVAQRNRVTEANRAASYASLDKVRAAMGEAMYKTLISLIDFTTAKTYQETINFERAERAKCATENDKKKENAATARDTNLANSQAAFDKALAAANVAKTAMIQSCHNQGGGN